jgi:hypothetical protein
MINVHQLLNGIIYAGAVFGALTVIGTCLHFGVLRPMRSFLRQEIVQSLVDIKDAVLLTTTATQILERKLDDHIASGGHMRSEPT